MVHGSGQLRNYGFTEKRKYGNTESRRVQRAETSSVAAELQIYGKTEVWRRQGL